MTSIQWTDETWNPTTGCTKVSPGCTHCYIERTVPFRIHGRKFVNGHIPLELHIDRLETPLHWKRPRRVFVNSLSDLFHDDVPDDFLHRVYHTMEWTRQHQFQVLTKRPKRMRAYLDWRYGEGRIPSRHIWHGVSVENRAMCWRIDELRETRSRIRFVSCEPLLEDLGELDLRGIHWVILGGESGPQARPCDLSWLRKAKAQCEAQGTKVFIKQLGAQPYDSLLAWKALGRREADLATMQHVGAFYRNGKWDEPAEWPADLRVREYPVSGVPARAGE